MGKDHEFLEAARNGNITLVEKILTQKTKRSGPLASLRRGPGTNCQDSTGYSALHHAALNGHSDIVRLLLAYDAFPNLPDTRGSSPLHLAAWAGHQEIVKLFLTHSTRPANPNLQTIENDTPLHCAAQHGHTGALTTLLAHSADPNIANSRGETPLDLAAQYGRLQAVQMIIRAHPELLVPFKLQHSSMAAATKLTNEQNEFINNRRCNSRSSMSSSLSGGATGGGACINGAACGTIVSHSPLHLASRNGHKAVVEILLAAGINVNLLTPSGTALHEAALCGKDSVVRTLLDAGADLDATDCEGRTALDILEEFPPHVTKGIVTVINNHRSSMLYDSESDDFHQNRDGGGGGHHKNYNNSQPMSLGSSYETNHRSNGVNVSPGHNYYNSHHDNTTSPSSSMGSLGPPSPPRPRASTGDLPLDFYIQMAPAKVYSHPPKKPPRRNLSVSPTHQQQQQLHSSPTNNFNSSNSSQNNCYPIECFNSFSGGGGGGTNNTSKTSPRPSAYEYVYMARSGARSSSEKILNNRQYSEQYVEMTTPGNNDSAQQQQIGITTTTTTTTTTKPKPAPRNLITGSNQHNYENAILKSYNPNRKLKRNRENYESFSIDFNKDKASDQQYKNYPQSPTNYQQPPTPEHSPPPPAQAEKFIHERIRPLSQEYKRRSGLMQGSSYLQESGTSPHYDGLSQSLCASSGSISSSVSMSDRSVSTDCVEEFIGDAPFAGLFKGSTMNLNNSNFYYTPTDNNRQQQQQQQQQQIMNKIPPPPPRRNHRSLSFGDVLDDDYNNENFNPNVVVTQTQATTNSSNNLLLRRKRTNSEDILETSNDAWAKISEIMQTFGSGILAGINSDSAADDLIATKKFFSCDKDELRNLFNEWELKHLCEILIDNGYDNIKFMNGILDESDLITMDIPVRDREKLIQLTKILPIPKTLPILNSTKNSNNNQVLSMIQWLDSIHLNEYYDIFRKHLYIDLESVCRIWEVELQTVLEINKLGHRKRIMYSVSANRISVPLKTGGTTTIEELNADLNTLKANIMELRDDIIVVGGSGGGGKDQQQQQQQNFDKLDEQKNNEQKRQQQQLHPPIIRHSNKKNRPAPKPPINIKPVPPEIRQPSELLLGLPSNLRTQWRHPAATLVTDSVKYNVYYLGSTVVKELRGTESTRKSIQKLKRDDRISLSTININNHHNHNNHHSGLLSNSPNSVQIVSCCNSSGSGSSNKRRPVVLAISHRGVEFIDVESQNPICEHEIRNINCACQDADDLSHFAYITKDSHIHYCHVFNVDSMDLATEIILTLGQAFEVAYQMALRDTKSILTAAAAAAAAGGPIIAADATAAATTKPAIENTV